MESLDLLDLSLRAGPGPAAATARPELRREARKGVPEVVLAEPKSVADLLAVVGTFLEGRGRVLVSRVRADQGEALCAAFPDAAIDEYGLGRTLVLRTEA